jgi:hypothetical protein
VASKVLVQLVDDIDGGEADQTVTFGLDGASYEIDLTETHAEELRASVDKFVQSARRIGGRSTTTRRPSTSRANGKAVAAPPEARAVNLPASQDTIRAWARSNGFTVGDKGRLAKAVIDAFKEANPS